MWWKFRLGDVVVTLFHSHGQEYASEGGVNNSRRDLFYKGVKPVKMQYG